MTEGNGVCAMVTKKELIEKIDNGEISRQEVIDNGWLSSVTGRAKRVKQPRGGYLRPRDFEAIALKGGGEDDLEPNENVNPGLVSSAVDYLTRVQTGTNPNDVFVAAKTGAMNVRELSLCEELLLDVCDLGDESIEAAIKLSGFDSAFRAGKAAYRPVEGIIPNRETIENVRKMVNRSVSFFGQYGPKVLDGLTFEGGYTGYVVAGDGDFLTKDALWDFKVSKQKLTTKHTLQLLMYWRMGLHSIHSKNYESIEYLGVYNPRQNTVYRFPVSKIPPETIAEVETEVIGY